MPEQTPRPDDEILQDALELPPEARDAFLDEACGSDPRRRAKIRALIAAHEKAGSFLGQSPLVDPSDSWLGERVGSFEITAMLGEGGAGRVYEARRVTGDFDQRVAIKLLRRSIDAADDERRFRVECEALARLDHPNVAHLIDGGFLEDAQPYLVMELIEGRSLYEYCDAQQLNLERRLRLFLDICSAVDYAHHNLVIHRDLKPSNILVTDEGRVKLLDFGIAKLVSPDQADPDATLTTQVRLTPRYASPEQLGGRPISTLSDVYSLGIVLYELITGKPPYELQGSTSREWERVVESTTITQPSGAIDDAASRTRGAALNALRKRLRGDLDNVVLKALHREPEQRYRSPGALAEDIERHLEGLPVRARPDTVAYRLSKFVRRHRVAVAGASIAIVALIAAAVVSTVALWRVQSAQDESERQRVSAERTVEFLQSMIASVDPDATQSSEEITVLELLENSERRIEDELSDEPLVAARLQKTLGKAYQHLQVMDKADFSLRRAVELYESELGAAHEQTLEARMTLAEFLAQKGDLDAARAEVTASLEHLGDAPEHDRLHPLSLLCDLQAQQGEFEAAIATGEEAMVIAQNERDDGRLLAVLNNVGLAYARAGNPSRSIEILREAATVCRRLHGAEHTKTGQALNNLGFTLKQNGRPTEAAPYLRDALAIFERVYEPAHTRIAFARTNLGDVLTAAGEFEEAEKQLRAAIESIRLTFGSEHVNTGHVTNSLGVMFMMKGDYEAAIPPLQLAADIYAKALDGDHPYVAAALHNKARSERRTGDLEGAMRTGQDVWRIRESVLAEDHPDIARSSEFMGRMMMDLRRPEEARPWFERSCRIRREAYAEDNLMRIDAERELGLCLQALGEYEAAEGRLKAARDALLEHRGADDERTVACEEELVALYGEWGKPLPER